METYTLKKDIAVFCITGRSFPDGIPQAFEALERLNPQFAERTRYGFSRPEHGKIVYKAAVEEAYEGEGLTYGCEPFVIRQGDYLAKTLVDYQDDATGLMSAAFNELLATPLLDTSFPCVEWYRSNREVVCMVRLDPKKQGR